MHTFLAALEEAGYEREDNPAEAELLRELLNSLSSGMLLLVPTDDVWLLDEDEREDLAIAKLDQLIELVVSIRTAWIASPESEHAREVEGRRLGPLKGDLTESESRTAAGYLQRSMSKEKRAEYDFCFQASGSEQFLFALVRQPSVLKGDASSTGTPSSGASWSGTVFGTSQLAHGPSTWPRPRGPPTR